MNLFKTALLSALAAGSLLTSSLATAKDLLNSEGQLDLVAIERELEEAEAEAARYSGGLIKSMIDMRIATLKAAAAMAYVNKSQEQSSQSEHKPKNIQEQDRSPVTKASLRLTCDVLFGDLMLRIDQGKPVQTISINDNTEPLFSTPFKLLWTTADSEEGKIVHCELERHTLKLSCSEHAKGDPKEASCRVVQTPMFPTTANFAAACTKDNNKDREILFFDLDRGVLTEEDGEDWELGVAGEHHLAWSQPIDDTQRTATCALNLYTGKQGCGIPSIIDKSDPHWFRHALVYANTSCKIIPPKI